EDRLGSSHGIVLLVPAEEVRHPTRRWRIEPEQELDLSLSAVGMVEVRALAGGRRLPLPVAQPQLNLVRELGWAFFDVHECPSQTRPTLSFEVRCCSEAPLES